jgi:pSer/pThr/pTyr-binding forkhead associated (FHA) protein
VAQEVTYEDLGSKNGSYRGGERLQSKVRLQDRDVVRVGLMNVTVRIQAEVGTTQTLAP